MDAPRRADLAFYRSIPFLLVVESVERDGRWRRRAAHPELPGCAAEADSALEAIEGLACERERLLEERWRRGEEIPVPRAPLRSEPRSA